MYSCNDTLAGWVAPFGYPRINACSRLPVAFRSVPRPSSPPGAKASTECPSYTRYLRRCSEGAASTMHRNHPQAQLSGFSRQLSENNCNADHRLFEDSPGNIYSAHNRILSNRSSASRLREHREKFDKIVHNASEPSPPTVGALSSQTAIPGQTIRPNDAPVLRGQWSRIRTGSTGQTHAPTPADDAPRDAPEPDSHSKEQRDHPTVAASTA